MGTVVVPNHIVLVRVSQDNKSKAFSTVPDTTNQCCHHNQTLEQPSSFHFAASNSLITYITKGIFLDCKSDPVI